MPAMSPVSSGTGPGFTFSQSVSISPDPNLPADAACQPQPSSFNTGHGLDFDFSKMGRCVLGQPRHHRRMRPHLKKLRKKSGSEDKKCAEKLFAETSKCSDEGSSTSTNLYDGNEGEKDGGDGNGKSGNAGFVFVGNDNGLFGTSRSISVSNSSIGSGSFASDLNKSSVDLNFDMGNGVALFGVEKSNSLSKSNPTNENFVFASDKDGTNSNFSTGNAGFVFGTDKNSCMMKSTTQNMSSVPSANASDDNMKKFDDVSYAFRDRKNDFTSDSRSEQDEPLKFSDNHSVFGGTETSAALEDRNAKGEDCGKDFWKQTPDMRSKIKSSTGMVSEKDDDTSFAFSTNWNHTGKSDGSCFFVGKGNYSTSTAKYGCDGTSEHFAASRENLDPRDELQKTNSGGVFVSGLGGKEELGSEGSNKDTNVMKKFDGKYFGIGSAFSKLSDDAIASNFKFVIGSNGSPSNAFYKVPLSKLYDEMKSLKIHGSKCTNGVHEVKNVRSDPCVVTNNVNFTSNSTQMSGSARTSTTACDPNKDANVDSATKSTMPERTNLTYTETCNVDFVEVHYSSKTCDSFGESTENIKHGATENTESRFGGGVSFSAEVFKKESQPLKSSGTSSPRDQLNYNTSSSKASLFCSSPWIATSHLQQNSCGFEQSHTTKVKDEGLSDARTPPGPSSPTGEHSNLNLNDFSCNTANLFTGLSKKIEFSANCASVKEKMLKKTRRKLRNKVLAKHFPKQSNASKEGSSPKNLESPCFGSPMDYSPYQGGTDGSPAYSCYTVTTENEEGDPSTRQRSDVNEGDKKSGEQSNMNFKDPNESYFNFSISSSTNNALSEIRRQYKKKYKLKVGFGSNGKHAASRADRSSAVQFSACNSDSSHRKGEVQSGVTSNTHSNADGRHVKQDFSESMTHGPCEQWRIRGNQAYKDRDLSKAEEFYTKGIRSVNKKQVSSICIEPLLLCYSNRAATRMSLGRLREALEDCKSAASLDPNFLKVKIRAANCHLVLGELEEAMQYYNKCLESAHNVCLDRRFTIEAADGLKKAQKVAECICRCADLLQKKTDNAVTSALDMIVEALSISCYSERLIEMKGEALLLLQKYDEVVKLCEQTLHNAEMNFTANHVADADDFECKNSVRLWRWHLMSKSHFHLGRLELALDLIEKQLISSAREGYGSLNQENLITLADTIRDLLHQKKAGNDSFQSGKHMEAIEHYTAAIACSVETRPFAAVCFCNRAAAYQALGQIVDAIADCSISIALDGNYPKAFSRRATLHEMIRDYKQATDDLQRLISLLENQPQEKSQQSGKLDGSRGSTRKELKQARNRLSIIEDKGKKGTSLDLYLILGIKASDTESDVKKAYRRAALRHHPDKAGQFLVRNDAGDDGRLWNDIVEKVHEDADRLFKMIGEAYAVLSDPDKRSKYNYEEEIRNLHSDSNKSTRSGGPSDFYSSPYDRGHWSGRQTPFYSSRSERSRNRRHWQESWRSYDDSHSRW